MTKKEDKMRCLELFLIEVGDCTGEMPQWIANELRGVRLPCVGVAKDNEVIFLERNLWGYVEHQGKGTSRTLISEGECRGQQASGYLVLQLHLFMLMLFLQKFDVISGLFEYCCSSKSDWRHDFFIFQFDEAQRVDSPPLYWLLGV